MSQGIALQVEPGQLAVCRLPADAELPAWARGAFLSLTRTRDELSIVCDAAGVPAEQTAQGPFRALRVVGTLDFALTGILAGLTAPLAAAGVPVFAISTYDTDYLLVRTERLGDAITALRSAGYEVRGD